LPAAIAIIGWTKMPIVRAGHDGGERALGAILALPARALV